MDIKNKKQSDGIGEHHLKHFLSPVQIQVIKGVVKCRKCTKNIASDQFITITSKTMNTNSIDIKETL